MTHDILQSDISLARRLLADQHPDEDIVTALVQRGVEPAKAAQLVDDLRNGRPVTAQPAAPPEFTAARRPRSKSRTREGESARRNGRAEAEPARQAHGGNASKGATRLVIAGVAVLAVVAVGIVLFQRYRSNLLDTNDAKPASPQASKPEAARTSVASPTAGTKSDRPASLALELQPDGLRLGGQRVTAANLLAVAIAQLGAPSRTNQVEQTGTTVFAYDSHGVLIYSQKPGGTNSIVLDCEATGGPNGTTAPFAGVLKVEDQVIRPDLDPQTSPGFQKLELNKPKNGGSIWRGRYHNVGLVFILKASGRLSLINIDLK